MPRQYDPARHCLKPDDWPVAERAAWDAALKKGSVFDKPGGAAHWETLTIVANAKSYGRWLSWLRAQGKLDAHAGPCQQLTPENVEAFADHLLTMVSTGMAAHRLGDLYTVAKALVPLEDWSWIQAGWYRLRHDARPVKNKAARVVNARELFYFGLDLMKRAEKGEASSRFFGALMYRDGLMIALLAARPLRRANFAAIRIGRHLARRGDAYWLHFTEDETKNEIELDWPFPDTLVPYLERYQSSHRPVLLARHAAFGRGLPPAGDHLWVTRYGSALTAHGLYGAVTERTKERFGHSVNPHLFRDAAATTIAIEDPSHVMSTKCVLGHHEARSSELYYNQARTTEACFAHQHRVRQLRSEARKGDRPLPTRYTSD